MGFSSPNLLSYFRFGQTWSETKTLQIILESFCIHSLAHAFTSSREALLACLPFPPWNLPSFTVKSALSSPCSCSDPTLSRQGPVLTHLDSLPLMIWYFGQTALFLFFLSRVAPAFLPTALSVALRPLFPFQQAQCSQSFFAEVCTILHAPF